MTATTKAKVLATLTAVIGGLSVVFATLSSFGINLTPDARDGIAGVAGLFLVVAGIWFHPGVPALGPEPPKVIDPENPPAGG